MMNSHHVPLADFFHRSVTKAPMSPMRCDAKLWCSMTWRPITWLCGARFGHGQMAMKWCCNQQLDEDNQRNKS